ncbi:tyrosine-type recombinase/integrase [uncultured Cloacibacillus sp.]|uniref:tyrosine-type recombinase/integrase n=1 Tax=uncultured Cloacibacillus sp. TaxID=889794 RepID=UPI0025EF54CD|nr:tyrosine-type recombinase/integrase [uncultured Cloacibacillus sp.]
MTLTPQLIEDYLRRLAEDERGAATIDKYRRDLLRFYEFLPPDKAVDKAVVLSWKEQLVARKYASSSVNVMLASVNGLLTFAGRPEWRAKFLKRQRAAFCDERRELRRAEYEKLVATARREKKTRLTLMMETICSTGIRVSELAFVTVEAVRAGRAELMLKGKCRRILFPAALVRKLSRYAAERRIARGPIFTDKTGSPVSRHRVWYEMKKLGARAGVAASKVFPHNLRHLFARTYYALERDLSKLADLLGHSSVETTRLYIITAGVEHLRQLDKMKLVM